VLPAEVEVAALRLPGRENRLRETPLPDMDSLIEAIVAGTSGFFDRPYAVLGHSMGALVGFELVRRLRASKVDQPVLLIASGHRGPHLPYPDPPIRDLPRDEFIEQLRRYNGTPNAALQSPELMDLMLPTLRADFSVCETYAYVDGPPLACPISAYGGLEDPDVGRSDLEAWKRHTSGAHVVRMFPGDHFFIQSGRDQVLRMVAHDLRPFLVGTD
jgi:medium-chain acyl-[acyl-carrier-protein] hydrolase